MSLSGRRAFFIGIFNVQFEVEIKKEDNIKIINTVISSYRTKIQKEDRESLKNESLWYSIRKYDSSKNMKFTTFLHKVTRYKCLTYIRDNEKARKKGIEKKEGIKYSTNYNYIDIMLDLSDYHRDLLVDRYISRMTIKEMGQKYDKPCEKIRLEILKIIENVRVRK